MTMTLTAQGTPTPGQAYDTDSIRLLGWTAGDGTGTEGYNLWDYFDSEGRYLGPDMHGIEPMIEITASSAVTDNQIEALSAAAAEAGDLAMVAICDRALDLLDSNSRIDDPDGVRAALEMSVEQARGRCAAVVADAAAQAE